MSFAWPNGAAGAVVLTYDDALPCHRERVAPALGRHGLRATFYLMAHAIEPTDVPAWRAIAGDGHELGNHSLFHPCRNDPERNHTWLHDEDDLRAYSPRRWHLELKTMNLLLHLIDGDSRRSFGNTCSDVTLGKGEHEVPMRDVLAGLVVGARGSIPEAPVDPEHADLYQLAGFSGDGKSFATIRQEIDDAVGQGRLATYMIHGVGEGTHHLFIDEHQHEALLGWLASERGRIWVAPLREVAEWIRDHR
jgi:sialate O-acetylesterase